MELQRFLKVTCYDNDVNGTSRATFCRIWYIRQSERCTYLVFSKTNDFRMTTSLVPITRRDKRQLCAKIVSKESVFQKPRAKFDLVRPMIKFDYCNPKAQNAYSPPEFIFHFISIFFSFVLLLSPRATRYNITRKRSQRRKPYKEPT